MTTPFINNRRLEIVHVHEKSDATRTYYEESYTASKNLIGNLALLRCSDLLRMLKPNWHVQKIRVYLPILLHMARLKLSIVKEMSRLRCAKTR